MSLSPSQGLEARFILFRVYGMAQCVMLNITEVEQCRGKQFTSLQPCRTCAAYLSAGRQRSLLSWEGWEQLLAAPGRKAVGGRLGQSWEEQGAYLILGDDSCHACDGKKEIFLGTQKQLCASGTLNVFDTKVTKQDTRKGPSLQRQRREVGDLSISPSTSKIY